jgi:hypothetical protein
VPQARFLLPINPELLLPVCPLLGTNIQNRRISDFEIAGFADLLNKFAGSLASDYSYLNVTMGSTREARRAGI